MGGICVSWGAVWQPRYKLLQQVPKDTERQSANCHWCYLNRVVAVGGVSFTQCKCEVTVHYCDKNQTGGSPIPGGSAGQRQGYGDRGQLSNESWTQTASSSLSEQRESAVASSPFLSLLSPFQSLPVEKYMSVFHWNPYTKTLCPVLEFHIYGSSSNSGKT